MTHADNKYFNQTEEEFTIDTTKEDLRYVIYNSSKITKELETEIEKDSEEKLNCDINNDNSSNTLNIENKVKSIYEMLIEENNSRVISDDLDEDMPNPKKID
jgi:hypothetical protein